MKKRSIPNPSAEIKAERFAELERFEEPYWGETPKLTPEQIVEWLEGHREIMSLVKKSSDVPHGQNSHKIN